MTTCSNGPFGTGSAAPGDPPIAALASHAFTSRSPYDGRASTSECPAPSAAVGHGGSSAYATSSTTAPERLRNWIVPPSFGREFVNPPITPVIPYTLATSAGTGATTR